MSIELRKDCDNVVVVPPAWGFADKLPAVMRRQFGGHAVKRGK